MKSCPMDFNLHLREQIITSFAEQDPYVKSQVEGKK